MEQVFGQLSADRLISSSLAVISKRETASELGFHVMCGKEGLFQETASGTLST